MPAKRWNDQFFFFFSWPQFFDGTGRKVGFPTCLTSQHISGSRSDNSSGF